MSSSAVDSTEEVDGSTVDDRPKSGGFPLGLFRKELHSGNSSFEDDSSSKDFALWPAGMNGGNEAASPLRDLFLFPFDCLLLPLSMVSLFRRFIRARLLRSPFSGELSSTLPNRLDDTPVVGGRDRLLRIRERCRSPRSPAPFASRWARFIADERNAGAGAKLRVCMLQHADRSNTVLALDVAILLFRELGGDGSLIVAS